MSNLTIFIQCHNRPAFAKLAIESVLRQSNKNFRLVISDNSDNDELCNLVRAEFPGLDYRRRASELSALEHFNISISDADTDFLCLFHDDDLMEPSYVETMLKTITLHPNAVAYSSNAEIINQADESNGSSFESKDEHLIIENPRALAGRYFSRFPNGIATFPAYIYRSNLVKQIPIDPQTGGKYSDVAWLLEISKHGSIVWNSAKLIRYRMHAENDGGFESPRDRLRLLGYLKSNSSFVGQAIIGDYRFFLYKKFCRAGSSGREISAGHLWLFKRYMLKYRIRRFFRAGTYAYLFHKLGKLFG